MQHNYITSVKRSGRDKSYKRAEQNAKRFNGTREISEAGTRPQYFLN
jgi:hypothetical protein